MRDFYEFFCGGGMAGVGLGADWRCTFANDICPTKGASFRANFPGVHMRVADVADLTIDDLPSRVDLAWASPPCQDLSLAGNMVGLSGARSGCFWPWWRLMEGLVAAGRAPRVICIENVASLITSNRSGDFAAIARALASAEYVLGALVIDAADFVPQSRERVFIVAVRGDFAPELAQDGPTEPFHTKALRKAFAAFPADLAASWRWWKLPTPPRRNVALVDVLDFDAPCDAAVDAERLLALMDPSHAAAVDRARARGIRSVGCVCRRMRGKEQRAEIRFDGLAQALRTPGGGSSIQRFVLIGSDGAIRSRKPTPRETATLMGLPESYSLPWSTTDAYQLTGDGVVVPVVAHINEHLLSRL